MIQLDKVALSDIEVSGLPQGFDDLMDIEKNYLRTGSFIVAEIESEIVGMGAVRFVDPETARINRMRVHPNHQRKGIARTILNYLEHLAEEAGKNTILLNTLAIQTKAQQLYESNGFIKYGEGSPDGFPIFMYRKQLGAGT